MSEPSPLGDDEGKPDSEGVSLTLTQAPPSESAGATYQPPSIDEHLKKQTAETARNLAFALVAMLGVSIAVQYVVLSVLVWRGHNDAVPNFEHLFNAWLPVIAGLASSAVTYYLTKK